MSYEKINPIQQFNFQINRVLTYGEIACDRNLVRERTEGIRSLEEWTKVWRELGEYAVEKSKFLHAAYYFRMAEFFVKGTDSEKEILSNKCIDCFYKAFDIELRLSYQRHDIPYEGKFLNCIRMGTTNSKGTIIVCGGYDSFIEEFVLQVHSLVLEDYDVILFEGPGQGRCVEQDLYFGFDFEKPTAAVLDYFNIKECAMIGISWGGYFALRSAAFEKRIKAVAAFDVMANGFEVMTHIFPRVVGKIIRLAYANKKVTVVNTLIKRIQNKSILADWAISQGMYITGTNTPYEFYENISKHTLEEITHSITQDVLLLAGEKDHYIPRRQYDYLKQNLPNVRSLTSRMFTEKEGGEQHCQIGNHLLATTYILSWLDKYF